MDAGKSRRLFTRLDLDRLAQRDRQAVFGALRFLAGDGRLDRENLARYMAHPVIVPDRLVCRASAEKVIYTAEAIHLGPWANLRAVAFLGFIAETVERSNSRRPFNQTPLWPPHHDPVSPSSRSFPDANGLRKARNPLFRGIPVCYHPSLP